MIHLKHLQTSCVSLGQYVQAFQTHPNNPLHSLCVGLTFFHMASQKYVAKRHTLVLQVQCLCTVHPLIAFSLCTVAWKSLTLGVCVCVFSGFLLLVAVCGATWSVSGEHVQPGQSAAPDGSHTFGHTLLPQGPCVACTKAGGKYTQHTGYEFLGAPAHCIIVNFNLETEAFPSFLFRTLAREWMLVHRNVSTLSIPLFILSLLVLPAGHC